MQSIFPTSKSHVQAYLWLQGKLPLNMITVTTPCQDAKPNTFMIEGKYSQLLWARLWNLMSVFLMHVLLMLAFSTGL